MHFYVCLKFDGIIINRENKLRDIAASQIPTLELPPTKHRTTEEYRPQKLPTFKWSGLIISKTRNRIEIIFTDFYS